MRALTVSFGATVLACNTGGCATTQTSIGTLSPFPASLPSLPTFGASVLPTTPFAPIPLASSLPYFPSTLAPQPSVGFSSQPFVQSGFSAQPYLGNSFVGSSFAGPVGGSSIGAPFAGSSSFGAPFAGSSFGASQYLGQDSLTYSTDFQLTGSPFSANKPWQTSSQDFQDSVPSSWQNSPSSVWTPTQQSQQGQVQVQGQAQQAPAISRPVNPSLAGRKPGEQLQITKCRSAQSCEKCRQLNCYWDSTGRIASRCIALGLESSNIPVEAGQASNLGYCPTQGQQGFLGVNWLAIENSGAAVPNLEGMSDASIQQWLSSIPNYNPDATNSNYPAGSAFQDLLPTAASAYASGKIPSTTPWISFFDSLSAGYSYDGGYSYDSYSYDTSTYDASYPSFAGASFGSSTSNFGVGVGAPSITASSNYAAPSFGGSFSNVPQSSGCGTCGR